MKLYVYVHDDEQSVWSGPNECWVLLLAWIAIVAIVVIAGSIADRPALPLIDIDAHRATDVVRHFRP